MIYYVYDGTFDGLLTCIYEAFYRRENPDDIVPIDKLEENFLIQRYFITTDIEKSSKVYKSIEEKISLESLRRVFNAYLSELPKSGINILDYLRLGYKIGKDIDNNLANDVVRVIDKINFKVSREKHLFLGILRFKMLENDILYATLEPEFNIVGLVAPHFANRMSNENWVIHDVKRNVAAFYNKKEWIIRDFVVEDNLLIHEDEEEYEEMWKAYYKHMAIESRKNLRLKKNYMPMRYWKHLVEI
ncbi:TIGR03915 family putative DNA repair protein [Tissierella sp. Yu-01]|uniref:TIGR03915 family putative DNA repair protein n=1 Tax=Tissierella sp. Yu-01 TaxID=3035694 RepID=UPI00240DF0E8|nr:TIGR03915 family putative DNA repair protein [Tissierella sp. Yu-01]WFA08196.1 TIGR03915 family putative DNA repair protein [Tissierella sp. Yu-01]